MKKCKGPCKQEKSKEEFYIKRYKSGYIGLRSYCKKCSTEARDQYRAASPKDNERNKRYNKTNAIRIKGQKLVKYWPGSTWQEALLLREALYKIQGEKCALCPRTQGLNVDHCHYTNVVRGLLCNKCNRGIGLLNDDPNLLEKAKLYVERHKKAA